jgi:hypothetical protein
MEAIPWAFHSDLIWLLGPDYTQTRQEFLYIVEGLVSIGATDSNKISMPQTKAQPCSLETEWGCTIETLTTQDPEKIASKAPDIIFMCEPGQIQDGIYERAIERLTTKRGCLVMAGTFEENTYTWFADKWAKWRHWPNGEDARSFSVPMWANTHTFPGGRQDPEVLKIERTLSKDAFLRRIAGIPTPSRKLILGDIWLPKLNSGKANHVGWYPFIRKENKELKPVELFIDPGWGSESYYYVGVVQKDAGKYRVVDEVAVQQMTHKEVAKLCMTKSWWPNVSSFVVEPWGGESHSLGNQNCIEAWVEETRMNTFIPAPRLPLDERITYLRDCLRDPETGEANIVFNEKTTPRIQWEIGHWRRSNVKSNASKPPSPSKMHCDGIKALASWLTVQDKAASTTRPVVRTLKQKSWYNEDREYA